jgi:Flp pilus assembly protein TadB
MPEPFVAIAAIGAGALGATAVLAVGYEWLGVDRTSIARREADAGVRSNVAAVLRQMERRFEQAGWQDRRGRLAVVASAIVICSGVLGATTSLVVASLALLVGCTAFLVTLNGAVVRRRRRLAGELVPLLELFTLELSGGGSALAALGSVCVQVESELAIELRRMLISSQVAGSASFEARLLEYAGERELAALGTLATILAASRDFGTAASQGVRALATDLRRAQRRELIAQSRRALNNVLLPAAVAVLLPFLGVLMFPAVSVLQRSLR